MDKFISELHYYLRQNLWHTAINFCTEELDKGRDPYVSFWRGFAYSQEGSLIEAIRDIEPLQNLDDYKYSALCCLLYIHGLYSNPDETKMDQIRMQLDIDSCNRNDCLNAMRLCIYLKDDEQFSLLQEKLNTFRGGSGEEFIIKGWKLLDEDNHSAWEEAKNNFLEYEKEFGNDNLDVIFGKLKSLEQIETNKKNKSYEEILDIYTDALKQNQDFLPLHIERIKIYLLKNDYDSANDYITSKLSQVKNFEIFKILALCNLMQDGDFKSAAYNLNKMWEIMQDIEQKNNNLFYITGKLFESISDKNADILAISEKMIDKALEYNPREPNYIIEKGYFLLYAGHIKEASEMFEKCGEIDSSNKDNVIGLIWCKIYQGKYREAGEDVKYMIEINESIKLPKTYKMCLLEVITQAYFGATEEKILSLAKEALKLYIQTNKIMLPKDKYEVIINTNYDFLLKLAEVLLSFYDFETKISLNSIPDTIRQAQKILNLLSKNKYLISGRLLIGKLHFLLSDYNKAHEIADDILNIDNKNIDALMFKALVCVETKDYRRAKEVINDAMINNLNETKENSSFLVIKSKCELGLNEIEHSQESLNKAIQFFDKTVANTNPTKSSLFKLEKKDKLELMKLNIDILMKLGKTEEAQDYMNKLVVEFQDMGDEILMLHSDLAIKTGDLKKAVHLLQKIDDKDERLFKKSRIKLADIYLNQVMDRRLYSWCYTQLIEKFPSFENYKLSANSLMVINAPDEAAEYYKKALKLKNDLEVMRDLGRALVKTHDYHEAIEYYLEASKLDEKNVNNQTVVYYWQMMEDYIDLMYLLARNSDGTLEEKIGKNITLKEQIEINIKKIQAYLAKYNETHLKSILAKFKFFLSKVLKYLYMESKGNEEFQKKEIFKQLEEATKLQKEVLNKMKEANIEDQIKEAKDFLSQIWYEIGQYYEIIEPKTDNCEKSYLESVNNDNTNIQALLGLSYTLMNRGKYTEAQNYINLLLKEDESNEEALALLVSVLNAKKDNESALDYLVGMIQKQPNSYHLIELYISILLRSGDISNAKDILYKSEKTLKFTYTPGLYFCKGLYHKYLGETNKALLEFSKAKNDEEYGIKCIEQILEIYMNPDCDILLINLDLPWNQRNIKGLLNYYTDDIDLDMVNFLLRELKLRRDDDKTKVYEMYGIILSKDPEKINEKIAELKEILDKNSNNLPVYIAYIMGNLILQNYEEVKNGLNILNKLSLNIKYYSDYERGFLIMAYLFMITDNLKKAEEALQKVIMLNLAQFKGYELLAQIKEKENKVEEACACYEKAWDYSNKNNASIGYQLAVNYLNGKQYVKAMNVCNEIKRKFKEYPIDNLIQQAKNGLAS
jgi:tetratricopeptide (TPR) repeat protein